MIDQGRFQELVQRLYATVQELEEMFPGRRFTPDGHMVGSIGECLVADAYGLELQTASNKGFDAVSENGLEVEIKATQATTVAFRSEPKHTIVIKILPDGKFVEIYNGPGALVWGQFEGKKLPKNGQFQISLSQLQRLSEKVDDRSKVPRVV
ncbi:MAG: hypothetical protein WB783_15710 [Arenicellales bacterium]|jgi:hypothetical protein